jgi:hypothetical protein
MCNDISIVAQPPSPPSVQYSPDGRYFWDGQQWVPVAPPPPAVQLSPDGRYSWDGQQWVPVASPPPRIGPGLEFEFDVGVAERHRVRYSFNKTWGGVEIDVDGQPMTREVGLFSLSTTRRWRLRVGQHEQHEVVIEKTRPLLYAGLRRQTCRVLVDGQPAGEYSG